jgi:FkbH-like protein
MVSLVELPWLRRAPVDFRDRCRSLAERVKHPDAACDIALFDMSNHALDMNQLGRIGKLAEARKLESHDSIFGRFRLGLLGSGTLTLIASAIPGSGLRHLTLIDVVEGEYGHSLEQALDPHSRIRSASLDSVLLAFDYRDLHLDAAAANADDAKARVEKAYSFIRAIGQSLRPGVSGPLLLQTVAPPVEPQYGGLDAAEASSPCAMVQALNARILGWAAESESVLVDAARLASVVGLGEWHDPCQWNSAKLPMAPHLVPLYADLIARTVAALRGRTRKCLVLDLDNTLWGGVIGDDGLEGIALGQGSAEGEAYLSVQRAALEYRSRGIVLAVSSKNDEAVAQRPFREHPDMLLKEDHITVFQANWQDKASNIRLIAERLNIGIDSLVFLDDNPFERELVRRELPLVAVPELPEDPALYARTLAWSGYFDTVSISEEDRKRADFYKANAARSATLTSSTDLQGYLRSLEMVCTIRPFDPIGRPRIAQLINKSNQFNFTTRRYTESEVAAMESDPDKFTMQVRLADKFGDNGMISVIVFDKAADVWTNDVWLMSCRVLGRRVEEAALAHICAAARAEGARKLIGVYLPTVKNQMVADLYGRLGFVKTESRPDGTTRWELHVDAYQTPDFPMTIDARAAG